MAFYRTGCIIKLTVTDIITVKRLVSIALACVIGLFVANGIFSPTARAQTQSPSQAPGICYSQCAGYKFIWRGDYCWDTFQNTCKISPKDAFKDFVSMLKNISKGFLTGKLTQIVDVSYIFKAWFICKPLIEDCIAPQLAACETTCLRDSVYYAPNLTVGHPYMNTIHGVYYSEERQTLSFKTVNNGLGYAWNIKAEATWGHTPNRDGKVSGGGKILDETIPELLFLGSRQAAPPTVTDVVADFLIDESNFSDFLSRYKSDADYQYIPPAWEKTIPFSAPDGELTKVFFNVDPNQDIAESSETDNSYVLEIDKRPTPAQFYIDDIWVERVDGSLTEYNVGVTIKNRGQEGGVATLAWYEGHKAGAAQSFATGSETIPGGGAKTFVRTITVDVSGGSASCTRNKQYSITVSDGEGISQESQFNIPLYAGYVSGRVTNTKGKPVSGVSVSTDTGQSASTNSNGFYALTGISRLGKVTVTYTHPAYTETQTKEIEMTFSRDNKISSSCMIAGLTHTQVDLVLRDIPVRLTLRLRDAEGTALDGSVMLSGSAGIKTYTVDGETVIDEAEVGQFSVTASAPGYITKFVQAVLTPPEQTLEIVLEKLAGRPNDTGLTLHTPRLIWEKSLPDKIDDIEGTKNGRLLVIYTSRNTQNSGKLHFMNPLDGVITRSVPVPATAGQQQVEIDVSYDGRTVGYMTNPGTFGKTVQERIVKVFNAAGSEVASTTVDKRHSTAMAVSPDGYYLYPNQLVNSSLYKYTRLEMEGVGEKAFQSYGTSEELKFLRDNTIVASCKAGQCVKSLSDQDIRPLGRTKGAARVIDASYDGTGILIRSDKGLSYFGSNSWDKALDRSSAFTSAAVSPGGEYVIVAHGQAGGKWLTLAVYDKTGREVTPPFGYKDIRYVEANDRGIFFSAVRSNKIGYYQLGSYAQEYNPPETRSDGTAEMRDLQVYLNDEKRFDDIPYAMTWDNLYQVMYRARVSQTLVTPWGSLTVGEGTIFSRNALGQPMLLWGQAQISASSPVTMVVFKNKLPDTELMVAKMDKYFQGTLSADEYMTVTNLHTDYIARTGKNGVAVEVTEGTVLLDSAGVRQEVGAGKTVEVTADNRITVTSTRVLWVRKLRLISALVLLALVIFRFRNSGPLRRVSEIIASGFRTVYEPVKKLSRMVYTNIRKLMSRSK